MRQANHAFENPNKFRGKRLYLATLIGAYNNNMDMHEQMLGFVALLRAKLGENMACSTKTYDDWGLVLHPGMYDGLLYVFRRE